MTKRGAVLIFSLLVVMVLSILLSSFFFKSANENNLVRRYISSTKAFWVAEGGIAEAILDLPSTCTSSTTNSPPYIGGYSFQTNTTCRTTIESINYFDINSTGIVGDIRRTLNTVVTKGANSPNNFQFAIQATNNICFGGGGQCKCPKDATCPPTLPNLGADPNKYLEPNYSPSVSGCGESPFHPCYQRYDPSMNTQALFGYKIEDLNSIATHYTSAPETISGVTAIDPSDGTAKITSGTGAGFLIINGNAEFGGNYVFEGIILVTGALTAKGNGNIELHGSVIVLGETDTTDYINGSPLLYWELEQITNALDVLNDAANSLVTIVAWKEQQ
ncbi:MAG: pilus assembly PilX N-terminal domain-containing protein [Candidatus Omnitrophica bacterium]|nr:pilus assembly PilX N-terminal domain-containing protein [Candidatus Omnitrophota bacterium]